MGDSECIVRLSPRTQPDLICLIYNAKPSVGGYLPFYSPSPVQSSPSIISVPLQLYTAHLLHHGTSSDLRFCTSRSRPMLPMHVRRIHSMLPRPIQLGSLMLLPFQINLDASVDVAIRFTHYITFTFHPRFQSCSYLLLMEEEALVFKTMALHGN